MKVRHTTFNRRGLGLFLPALLIAGAVSAQQKSFDVPATDAVKAIPEFARQAGIQIVAPADDLKDVKTLAIRGELDSRAALRQLLVGTGLEVAADDGTIITLRKTAAPLVTGGFFKAVNAAANIQLSQSSPSDSPEVKDPNKGDASKEEDPKKIEEIVVTAQKREEKLQDVPISIAVLSGEALEQSSVTGTTDALRRVTGVFVGEGVQGGGTSIAIRGVSAGANHAGASPIAYYIDGLPFGMVRNGTAPDPAVYDLKQIEVLRGPQGTLYGASAMNGVVRILTQEPDLDEFQFKARASISNTQDGGWNYGADAAINIPMVNDKLAFRGVFGLQDRSGWIDAPNKDDVNDAQLRNVRLKLKAQPSEALSIDLSAWLTRNGYGSFSLSDANRNIAVAGDQSITTDTDLFGLTISYDLPAVSIKSVSSYLNYRNLGFLDLTFLVPDFFLTTQIDSKVISQELYLASTDQSPWRWAVGGMYRNGKDTWYQVINGFHDKSESSAVFGELTRSFADDRFELTGGLRYFEDNLSLQQTVPTTANAPLVRSDAHFKKLTKRAVLTWHASDDLTLYGSYSEGFRSGTMQLPWVLSAIPGLPSAGPDTLTNYEIGVKGSALDRLLDFDLAFFYIDWQDQLLTIGIPYNGVTTNAYVNSESTSGLGFDASVTLRPASGLSLGANFGWNDLALDGDVTSLVGNTPVVLFPKDFRVPGVNFTANAFVDYSFPLGGAGLEGRFSVSANYHSAFRNRILIGAGPLDFKADAILIPRASFSIDSPQNWSATLFVDNITDTNGFEIRGWDARPFWDMFPRPRTVRLQVDYAF